MCNRVARFAGEGRCVLNEERGGGALPSRVRGREVRADVTFSKRAEQGIDDGVQGHVGVAVSGQPLVVRNTDAAQP